MANKFTYKIIIIIFLLLAKIIMTIFNMYNSNSNYRVLVYSCCDELYSHYIPIFLNTILRADKLKLIDIEICTNLYNLSEKEEKAIDFLRKKYSHSKIIINYNAFIKNKTGIYFNNTRIKYANSIRFVSQPTIKNKYVYITDIDILIFVDNFYLYLIDDMIKRKNRYSNIVRPNSCHLSGLHFTEYDAYYPIPKQKNYLICDEILLYNIVKSKGLKIDKNTKYRPVFGVHASPNRPHVYSDIIVGWGAENYKNDWINYCNSKDFKYIYPLLDKFILLKIKMLNNYYRIKEIDFTKILNKL